MGALIGPDPLRIALEDLLPLLVFAVIWWVSSRRAKKRRATQSATPSRQAPAKSESGLPPRDEERVDPVELLRQMLFGGLELPPLPPEPPAAETSRLFVEQDEVWSAAERGGETASVDRRPQAAAVPRPEETRDLPRQPPKPGATVRPGPGSRSRCLVRVSRQELQRAVIWSELLAPPVGLRDEH